jgi:hypothetical protein
VDVLDLWIPLLFKTTSRRPVRGFARRALLYGKLETINEPVLGRGSFRFQDYMQPRVFAPYQIRQGMIVPEDSRIALVEDLAEGLDGLQKAAFSAVIGADQDREVAEVDRDIAQAFVILDVNALEHRRYWFVQDVRVEFVA